MRINTNLTALNTFTQYTNNNEKIKSSVGKLSSGSAINNAADNAAGLAISEKMRAQIRGLEKASTNAQDAISLVQTAEGSLGESTEILQRMRELAVQSASDTNENEIDREALQDEFSQLQAELDDISQKTTFNKKNLLDGSLSSSTKSVNITKLANSTTAISLGNADAGNYSFTVSTKQKTAAISADDGEGTASLGTIAKATVSDAQVAMGEETKGTALYNGNYSFSTEVNSDSSSLTVTATGDNGQTFTAEVARGEIDDLSSVSINFETSDGADDSFTLTLNLNSKTDADSANGLQTLATAIDDVTVSVDGGVDAKEATFGVYANITGGTSVKLNAGDSSVSFDNGVTVSFDKLTATDVAVDAKASELFGAGTPVADTATYASGSKLSVTYNLGTAISGAALAAGEKFAINIGDKSFTGTYNGETGTALNDLIAATIDTGEITTTVAGATPPAVTTTVTNGTLSFTTASDLGAGNTVTVNGVDAGAFAGAWTDGMVSISKVEAAVDAFVTTPGSSTTSEVITSSTNVRTSWALAKEGDTVYYQINDTVYEGKVQAGADANARADNTLANMLDGKSFTDSKGNIFDFTSVSTGQAVFTSKTLGNITDTDAKTGASRVATGNSATLSDGLVGKLGKESDEGSTTTTATTFSVSKTANDGLTFQVGANEGDEMVINIEAMNTKTLGINSAKVSSRDAASSAIGTIDKAINQVSSQRAYLGAVQNRLDHKIANLDTSTENLTAAESQIRDVDMAKEMTKFTNSNILAQAATAMLAQANSLPQGVLSLLG